MKIVHIITSLGDGGAEHTLFKICKYDYKNKHIIISLKGPGKYYSLLNKIGIKVYCINLKYFSITKFFFLVKILRKLKPDIIQTWLVHADLLGSIAAKLAGLKKIIWNIRYSNLEIGKAKFSTILIIKLLAKLSFSVPQLILVVSKRAKKIYEIKGYDKQKLKFIPNGYDLSLLKPDKSEKKDFRKKFNIKGHLPIIGNVARYDKKKDHLNLLKAISLIKLKKIDFLCFLVGSNINKNNFRLVSEIRKLKLTKYVKLIGQRDSILKFINGFDIYVQSSSYGEGFPNVVAESMACKIPCIVTDVGDASYIVGETGWVVPPSNSKELAKSIENAINEVGTRKWNKRCNNARSRIKVNFNISKMLKSYNKSWYQVYRKNI